MQLDNLRNILDSTRDRRVLVVGDVMMDEYVWGKVRRISPEAPVMVVEVQGDSDTPGGAANVVNNVQALGGQASIVGVVGNDIAGERLTTRLAGNGVDTRGIVIDKSRPTTRKTRIIAHNQQVVRVDRECRNKLSSAALTAVVGHLEEQVSASDVIVFSDYNKGMATPHITEPLLEYARRYGKRVIVNPKPSNYKLFRTAYLVSLNQEEASQASGVNIENEEDVLVAAKKLAKNGGPDVLLITRGPDGMSLHELEGTSFTIPAHPVEVYDVAGAGDTVVSVLSLAIGANAPIKDAAFLANCAGGAAVRKVGVATVSKEEILSMAREEY